MSLGTDGNSNYESVIIGSGFAGFAAAMHAADSGERVLLIGERGDLVWEAGRGFFPFAGYAEDPVWQELRQRTADLGGATDDWLDGAIVEAVASRMLLDSTADALYYARPAAAEVEDGKLLAVDFATRIGQRRITAVRWVDATETGALIRLLSPHAIPRPPARSVATLMLQHPDWGSIPPTEDLLATAWPTERAFALEVACTDLQWRPKVLDALASLEARLGDEISKVALSHLSMEPVPEYRESANVERPALPSNVQVCSPAFTSTTIRTLSDRFELGTRAPRDNDDVFPAPPFQGPIDLPLETITVDVCVVGAGTGGAFAAIAAGRHGASTMCLDPLTFVGGSSTGAGIHVYWFGVPGGLQMEVDKKVHQLMRSYQRGPLADGPFNPWAKMLVLEQELAAAGVDVRLRTVVTDVERDGDRITALQLLTDHGPLRVEASVFVEATGDGDLLAMSGAPFTFGRERDGLAHAYTQTAGRLQIVNDLPRMEVVNIDSGFCDVTNPVDVTRARLEGVAQHAVITRYTNTTRPTYIAPVLGVREGRRFETDYELTLDDQISGRRFEDSIGFTASNVDTHATDYEFESDELVFWLWVNRQWNTPIACDMNYRMLLVQGLSNTVVGSRCLGASHDAMYATRMQRDIQRVGEVAGTAAAMAAAAGNGELRDVSYAELGAVLRQTGAINKEPRALMDRFGVAADVAGYVKAGVDDASTVTSSAEDALVKLGERSTSSDDGLLTDALDRLDAGEVGTHIWWLYTHRPAAEQHLLARLSVQQKMPRWLASCILAMWGDTRAEPNLVRAVEERDYGFGNGYPWTPEGGALSISKNAGPIEWDKVTPNWVCAIVLLRRCGTSACLGALDGLFDGSPQGINTLTAAALTIEALISRDAITRNEALRLIERIRTTPRVGTWDYPGRAVGRYSELAQRGATVIPDIAESLKMTDAARDQLRNTYTDNVWQLELAIARCLTILDEAESLLSADLSDDLRGYVRAALTRIPSGKSRLTVDADAEPALTSRR